METSSTGYAHPSVKILHCVYSMNRGGTETWLFNVVNNIDRERFQIDFMVHTDERGDYDEAVAALGSRIHRCSHFRTPLRHFRDVGRILRERGPFDVVHSHDAVWNGPVMLAARNASVPIRIIHSHNVLSQINSQGVLKGFFIAGSMRLSRWCATHGLACSSKAAESYFGRNWREDSRWRVFLCGVDLSGCREDVNPYAIRKEFGLDKNDFVVGHVGSFREEKNHELILRIAAEMRKSDPAVRFLLVGDGPLRRDIEDKACQLGLDTHVIFAGSRSDVSRLMSGAMNLFLFPSTHEGLGLVMVEAQAAGLRCICSDAIPAEAYVVPELCTTMSLTQEPSEWAGVILETRESKRTISQKEALAEIENTDFNIEKGVNTLQKLYATAKSA